MEELIELLQQNWEKYNSGDLDFLEKLDKKQILLLFKQFKNNVIKCTNRECYHCLKIDNHKTYKNLSICKQCIKGKNYIDIKCYRLEKDAVDLKKHIIGVYDNGKYYCIDENIVRSTNTFTIQVKNQQWYNHCFGTDNIFDSWINESSFIFDLNNELHYYLFMQCTRFNHYSKFLSLDRQCEIRDCIIYYKPQQNESSVEEVIAIIDTARLIFRQFRVPKCLRNLIIEWYLI